MREAWNIEWEGELRLYEEIKSLFLAIWREGIKLSLEIKIYCKMGGDVKVYQFWFLCEHGAFLVQ